MVDYSNHGDNNAVELNIVRLVVDMGIQVKKFWNIVLQIEIHYNWSDLIQRL